MTALLMTTPKRIQLSRTKGWRKPPDAAVVSRPTKYGNPFPVINGDYAAACAQHRAWVTDPRAQPIRCGSKTFAPPTPADLASLRGKDLCCWCPLDGPCHADVLLELAK
jgi:Domain of unknown function (DUF4326)